MTDRDLRRGLCNREFHATAFSLRFDRTWTYTDVRRIRTVSSRSVASHFASCFLTASEPVFRLRVGTGFWRISTIALPLSTTFAYVVAFDSGRCTSVDDYHISLPRIELGNLNQPDDRDPTLRAPISLPAFVDTNRNTNKVKRGNRRQK
ncbi:hypothetical protein [Bradyrhizobium sp. NAS96.2]|uniref:hypothetical protein n=1 Tax=Bradyrhizobium sp. NAS96.2 TaxID=1680160 RepID=UPI001160E67C|nr:hypothetical protein [Bradyrhizobium sp. NAS96.2]